MDSAFRQKLLLFVVLLCYTVLAALPFALACRPGRLHPPASLHLQIATAGVLFLACFSYLAIWMRTKLNAISRLQNRLERLQDELSQTRRDNETVIEKRTFEVAVVNASLNREIAERIQAETQSKELQKQFELILNSAGEGIFGLDTRGNVTFVNTAAALMVGWEARDMIGKSHHDLVHHTRSDGTPYRPGDCLIRLAYRDGIVHYSSDDVFWTKEGTSFPVEYVSTPILDNNRLRGAVVVFRDLSTYA